MKNLIYRTIFGALFVAIMVFGICWSPLTLILLFALILSATLHEYITLVNQIEDVRVNPFITVITGMCFYLGMASQKLGIIGGVAFAPFLLNILYLIISELYTKQKNPINNWAYTMFGLIYIALPFSLVLELAFQPVDALHVGFDWLLPLSIFIFLWTNDTGAYCFGSLLGRHKLFPRISPGKSWEGSIGGGITVLVVAVLIGYYSGNTLTLSDIAAGSSSVGGGWEGAFSTLVWMGLGLIVVVFGTLGDLVESLFKRTLGIKDSGNIIPGHGGMLDRFDSSLMAIPAAVIYLYVLSLI
jgi:phosphatidate cytidylyltransferase